MGGAPTSVEAEVRRRGPARAAALHALPESAGLVRPTALGRRRLLEVDPALEPLLPDGALRRGTVLAVGAAGGSGATSLAVALTVAASRSGSWVAAVGLADLGLVAAAQLGADLDRLVLVPHAGEHWTAAAAALLDGVDILVLGPPPAVRASDARRLGARARERGAVVIVAPVAAGSWRWPEPADVHLVVRGARWYGLGEGCGYLHGRLADVEASGRRAAARVRRERLWLPGPDGRVAAATDTADVVTAGRAGSEELLYHYQCAARA